MFVAGNWKMFKGPAEAAEFCAALRDRIEPLTARIAVAVCPPFTALGQAVEALRGSGIEVYAQNVHWQEEGAFTGEIAPGMLREIGVAGALVGHSERRQYFGETDESVARRVDGALAGGLRVIACVGELEEEREAGQTEQVLRRQVGAILPVVERHEPEKIVVAYEPVWAIGTGKTATPEIAQEAHAFVKTLLDVPLLYGGSVRPENALELLAQPDVDGALVGGASLQVESFAAICEAARRIRS